MSWIKPWDVTTGLAEEEMEAILQTLRSGLPVCAGLRWPKEPKWDNGLLGMCPAEEVFDGHSVLMVGFAFDRPESPEGVFIFRDSGSGGRYASLPFEFARAYVNDAAVISE